MVGSVWRKELEGKMARKGADGTGTPEQRPEGGDSAMTMRTPGEEQSGVRNSQCKGPEVGICLACLGRGREATGQEGTVENSPQE